ncbi:MAG: 1-deoxy-D-xylulose-5-phosphate reductoisomerase [Psittacicella sp.]
MKNKGIVILGATGSIGTQTAQVASDLNIKIVALTSNTNTSLIIEMYFKYKPKYIFIANKEALEMVSKELESEEVSILDIEFIDIALKDNDTTDVMSSIMGIAGLKPTLKAIRSSKRILLANKESLITSGSLFIKEAFKYNSQIIPIDSEHSAIFQCLNKSSQNTIGKCDLESSHVNKIILTGSGGPFLYRDLETFKDIKVEEALKHPNWSMGSKITIDSATMMNKGFEYIEARWLFNCNVKNIEIVIHPQSIVHSMVSYKDGAIIAQLGTPDMKVPISYGITFPKRVYNSQDQLDFVGKKLDFVEVDYIRYPNLKLAIDSFQLGQYATTALNAANEIAVERFLMKKISFNDIYKVNFFVVNNINPIDINSIEDVFNIDLTARSLAKEYINTL